MTGSTAVVPVKGQGGFTLIDMLFVIALLGLTFTLAIPGLMRAKDAAQSSSALGTMRVVNSAQLSFAITCGVGFYAPDFPTLGLKPAGSSEGFIPPGLAMAPTFLKAGYNFSMAGTPLAGAPASCNGLPAGQTAAGYAVVADQVDATVAPRFFGSNRDGWIYEHKTSLAAVMPEDGAPAVGRAVQ